MNIHHLELFYYVAKHEGISGAVRNMPYGIQQPAVSAQVIQLENDLGITLFQRRPFELTAAGEELYGFIAPFFEGLEEVSQKIRGGVAQTIRIAASTTIFRDHLPDILGKARAEFPGYTQVYASGFSLKLSSGYWRQKRILALPSWIPNRPLKSKRKNCSI